MPIEREPGVAAPSTGTSSRGGGYYQDDGPGDNPPANLAQIPDAVPRVEPLARAANKPYSVFGHEYVPYRKLTPYHKRGIASWYGRKFHGQRTSSGEIYDMYAMTAAHTTLPIPSYARVTNLGNGRSVIVRVNDRGPFLNGRLIDLSYAAAYKLGYIGAGRAKVEVDSIMPEEMPLIAARQRQAAPSVASAATVAPVPAASAPVAAVQAPVIAARVPATEAKAPVIDASAQVTDVQKPATEARAPVVDALSPKAEARPPQAETQAPAVTAAAEPQQTIPVDAEAGGIYLQLGAFSARANAESFRVRIYQQLSWLNDAIRIFARDGMYRLHLGPYHDRKEATSMAERIAAALQFRPFLVVH